MSSGFVRIDTTRRADIRYIVGSSGAGKSFYIKKEIEHDARLLIFDPDDEYNDIPNVETFFDASQFVAAVAEHKTGRFRARLVANGVAAFETVNAVAFAWTNCTVVAEEIADVTTTAKAPPKWGQLLRRGRKRAIKIFCVTQRPSEADKTALTQATMIRTGLLGREPDRRAMAADLDIPNEMLAKLAPLDYVEVYRNAQRTVIAGNAAEGTRADITKQIRG